MHRRDEAIRNPLPSLRVLLPRHGTSGLKVHLGHYVEDEEEEEEAEEEDR